MNYKTLRQKQQFHIHEDARYFTAWLFSKVPIRKVHDTVIAKLLEFYERGYQDGLHHGERSHDSKRADEQVN